MIPAKSHFFFILFSSFAFHSSAALGKCVHWALSHHIDVHVIYVNFQKRGNFSSDKIHNKYQQDVNIVNISSDILFCCDILLQFV